MTMNSVKRCFALVLALCMCMAMCSCSKETVSEDVNDAINVTVHTASSDDISATADYTGEIIGAESASVSAKVSGEAEYIAVKEGDFVNAGDTLLTIDAVSYQLAYNQARAAYNSAVSGRKSAEANYNSITGGSTQQSINQLEVALNAAKIAYDNALDVYNKQNTLYTMGAISQMEFNTYKTNLENAKLNYDSAKANYEITKNVVANESEHSAKAGVESADAAIAQAKAAMDIAANNLANCTVTAPISGYVSQKNVTKGQMVSAGMGIFAITNTSSVEVAINVTESVIPKINVGTKATVNVHSAKLENIGGEVSSFNPVKNPATGLYTVKIAIPNDNGALKEGMMANLTLITESSDGGITVPSAAIMQSDEDGYYVYIANGETAEKRPVEIGIENDEFTEIISGIDSGDKVIVDGKEYISDNNKKIRIVEE